MYIISPYPHVNIQKKKKNEIEMKIIVKINAFENYRAVLKNLRRRIQIFVLS